MNKSKQFISAAIIAGLSSVAMAGVANSSGHSSVGFHTQIASKLTNQSNQGPTKFQAEVIDYTANSIMYSIYGNDRTNIDAGNVALIENDNKSAHLDLTLYDNSDNEITNYASVPDGACIYVTGSQGNYSTQMKTDCIH